ncbi:MAG: histidine phosphatase family protein [Gemmatimonadetes bacterium]|nr:histidine phosphatase family protein [Gemmatimonadota bacterium]
MTILYLVRHGEVHNPTGIIYGRLPNFGLSDNGRAQLQQAAELLAPHAPFQGLYASPMQRAQESAAILGAHLNLEIATQEQIIETGIGAYQGKRFEDLPKPYITEEPVHEGIECAASIRKRILTWVDEICQLHPDGKVIAVSHRDPIIVTLLHWIKKGLEDLPDFDLPPGGVHEIILGKTDTQVRFLQ